MKGQGHRSQRAHFNLFLNHWNLFSINGEGVVLRKDPSAFFDLNNVVIRLSDPREGHYKYI